MAEKNSCTCVYIKNQSISKKKSSLRNLCLKTANDKCQIRVATAIHVSVNKTSLLFICALITWLKSCWCSIKTFIQDTYFFYYEISGFLTRILSHIRKTHMNHVIQIFKDRTKAISRAELLGKHNCSCLLPEWWNFTMHYVSIIEIYLKNCFFHKQIRIKSNLRAHWL